MSEEESIEQIENIINSEELIGVSRDPLDGRGKGPSSPVKETVIEEVKEAIIEEVKEEGIKPKAEPRAKSKAKPTITITKQSVECSGVSRDPLDGRGKAPSSPIEPIKEEEEEEEAIPVVEEKPKNDKLKEMVQCPDCGLSMTQHALNCTHKKEAVAKVFKKLKKLKKKLNRLKKK